MTHEVGWHAAKQNAGGFFQRWCDFLSGSHSAREEQNGCVSTRALNYGGSQNLKLDRMIRSGRKEHVVEGEFHRCTTQEHRQSRKNGKD